MVVLTAAAPSTRDEVAKATNNDENDDDQMGVEPGHSKHGFIMGAESPNVSGRESESVRPPG